MNPYDVLGVDQDASKDDIKKAYKKLAMKNHPDKGGDPKKFQDITNAYEQLTKEQEMPSFGREDFFDHMDIFSHFFGGRGGRPNKKVLKKVLKVNMKNVYQGTKKQISVTHEDVCQNCDVKCKACNGRGIRTVQISNIMGNARIIQAAEVPCDKCINGRVAKPLNHCSVCNNTGKIKQEKVVVVDIPKGTPDNKVFNFEDILPNTCVQVIISIEPMMNYSIQNNHLIYTHRLDFIDSIFGKQFEIEHPSGNNIFVDTNTMKKIVTDKTPLKIEGSGMTPSHFLQINFDIIYPKINTSYKDKERIKNELLKFLT